MSSPGFLAKKPEGFRWARTISTGMIGQSSGRAKWLQGSSEDAGGVSNCRCGTVRTDDCNSRHAETRPEDNVLIFNVSIAIDPLLKTEVASTGVLVDMDIGRVELLFTIRCDDHLQGRRGEQGQPGDSRPNGRQTRKRTFCRAKGARFQTIEPSCASRGGMSRQTNLYATGLPDE